METNSTTKPINWTLIIITFLILATVIYLAKCANKNVNANANVQGVGEASISTTDAMTKLDSAANKLDSTIAKFEKMSKEALVASNIQLASKYDSVLRELRSQRDYASVLANQISKFKEVNDDGKRKILESVNFFINKTANTIQSSEGLTLPKPEVKEKIIIKPDLASKQELERAKKNFEDSIKNLNSIWGNKLAIQQQITDAARNDKKVTDSTLLVMIAKQKNDSIKFADIDKKQKMIRAIEFNFSPVNTKSITKDGTIIYNLKALKKAGIKFSMKLSSLDERQSFDNKTIEVEFKYPVYNQENKTVAFEKYQTSFKISLNRELKTSFAGKNFTSGVYEVVARYGNEIVQHDSFIVQ
jgi:hypothetical protein